MSLHQKSTNYLTYYIIWINPLSPKTKLHPHKTKLMRKQTSSVGWRTVGANDKPQLNDTANSRNKINQLMFCSLKLHKHLITNINRKKPKRNRGRVIKIYKILDTRNPIVPGYLVSKVPVTWQITLMKPISLALVLKHCLQHIIPYFLINPWGFPQTRLQWK